MKLASDIFNISILTFYFNIYANIIMIGRCQEFNYKE